MFHNLKILYSIFSYSAKDGMTERPAKDGMTERLAKKNKYE